MTSGNADWKVAGYVLAGGGSTRFGRDKALIEFGGKPMLVRMAELLGSVTSETFVVAAPERYAKLGLECIPDRWPGEGPLGGIITALLHSQANAASCKWNFVVSCDMPFLAADWIQYMTERAAKSAAHVLLPHSASGPEPLCACYRTDAAEPLRAAFESGVRKITEALKRVEREVLDERDWKRFDSEGRLFWNMNTAADYAEAVRILEAERK
jgi:molybdopterin-guanine dinucleotide biosynthesis protein A